MTGDSHDLAVPSIVNRPYALAADGLCERWEALGPIDPVVMTRHERTVPSRRAATLDRLPLLNAEHVAVEVGWAD
jgi:hypothetical protein